MKITICLDHAEIAKMSWDIFAMLKGEGHLKANSDTLYEAQTITLIIARCIGRLFTVQGEAKARLFEEETLVPRFVLDAITKRLTPRADLFHEVVDHEG
jgi:hypothetical protein